MSATPEPGSGQPDFSEIAKVYADIAQKSGQLVTRFLEQGAQGAPLTMKDELGIAKARIVPSHWNAH